jgi:hypothetical protein
MKFLPLFLAAVMLAGATAEAESNNWLQAKPFMEGKLVPYYNFMGPCI